MITTSALLLMSVATSVAAPRMPAPGVTVQQARRISGETRFAMPSALESQMNWAGETEMDYRARLCVGSDGKPRSLRATERTGVRQADDQVARTLMAWRFSPYRVDGRAVPFCEAVRYRFELPSAGLVNPPAG